MAIDKVPKNKPKTYPKEGLRSEKSTLAFATLRFFANARGQARPQMEIAGSARKKQKGSLMRDPDTLCHPSSAARRSVICGGPTPGG